MKGRMSPGGDTECFIDDWTAQHIKIGDRTRATVILQKVNSKEFFREKKSVNTYYYL